MHIWEIFSHTNAFGTQAVYYLLQKWTWLETIGFRPDGYFAAARLFVSLIVSWFWNFAMQRYFVYRECRFDNLAISLLKKIGINSKNDGNGNKA